MVSGWQSIGKMAVRRTFSRMPTRLLLLQQQLLLLQHLLLQHLHPLLVLQLLLTDRVERPAVREEVHVLLVVREVGGRLVVGGMWRVCPPEESG